MFDAKIFRSIFGNHYRFMSSRDCMMLRSIQCKRFSNVESAERFLRDLAISDDGLSHVISESGSLQQVISNRLNLLKTLAQMLLKGEIKIVEVDKLEKRIKQSEETQIKSKNGMNLLFLTAKEALAAGTHEIIRFYDKTAASKYIDTLSLNDKQLENLMEVLLPVELPVTKEIGKAEESAKEKLSKALAEEVVVISPSPAAPPKTESEQVIDAGDEPGNRDAGLGPEPDEVIEKPLLVPQKIDPLFAPGVEELELLYDIKLLEGETVVFEIVSDDYTGKTLFKRELDEAEKVTGDGKLIKWDGKVTTGDLNGKWASPVYKDYKAKLYVNGDASLGGNKSFKIEIDRIEINVDVTDNKIYMNEPESTTLVTSKVYIKNKAANGVPAPIELDMLFQFAHGGTNTAAADSYQYLAPDKKLGKKGNATSVYWKDHADCDSSSSDSYKTKCKVKSITASGADMGTAKIWFIASGVGGNSYKIKVESYAKDDVSVLASAESADVEIWRKIEFSNIYTMDGENYIDTGTEEANITPAFIPAYVKYERGGVTTLNAALTVKYIGLYDKASAGSKNWPADFSPASLETSPDQLNPTATELADFAGADVAKKAAAKTAIEIKAQAWFTKIVADYSSCVSDWFTAASVPGGDNSLLAVQYYHPKLSGLADGATNFWPAGISINLANPGSGMNTPGDPDGGTWREVQGFNRGKIVVVFKNYGSANRLKTICRHEIGHATKSEFKRDEYGAGDHSASGLMTAYGSSTTFSTHDKKILRGITP